MKNVYSTTYCTKDPEYNNRPRFTIEFEPTFWQMIFKKPSTVTTYVMQGSAWRNADTHMLADTETWLFIEAQILDMKCEGL